MNTRNHEQHNKTISPKMRKRRNFFMVLPLLVVPFLCIAFYALGGGGSMEREEKTAPINGFNMELPPAVIDKKEDKMDKLAYYQRADADSTRRKELLQMDPYRRKAGSFTASTHERPKTDTATEALVRKLDILKRQVSWEEKTMPVKTPVRYEAVRQELIPRRPKHNDTVATDPELDRLNEMLDKIARLQGGEHVAANQEKTSPVVKETAPEVSVAIPATVDNNQELMNGATLSMRLISAISYHGVTIPKDHLVYGMVSMSGDRLHVSIHSIRCGASIITTSWQVYDMDGLQGIRIPDGLGRRVARQSADQGVGALNLMTYDPSIGGQVAGAGIQMAKGILRRKIRPLSCVVPAGYQVLLRDTRMGGGAEAVRLLPDTMMRRDTLESTIKEIHAPSVDSLKPYLHASVKEGRVKLMLKGIYLRDSLMWLYMTLKDESALGFIPDHVRCSIRQEKHWRRMAVQEVPLEPVCDGLPSEAVGDEKVIMVGLRPFVLAKDKRLVVEMGERTGARRLELSVRSNILCKINERETK